MTRFYWERQNKYHKHPNLGLFNPHRIFSDSRRLETSDVSGGPKEFQKFRIYSKKNNRQIGPKAESPKEAPLPRMRIDDVMSFYKTNENHTAWTFYRRKSNRYNEFISLGRCDLPARVLSVYYYRNTETTNMLIKFFAVFVCFSAVIGQIFGSSIPMWEYLTKDEKVRAIQLLESRK